MFSNKRVELTKDLIFQAALRRDINEAKELLGKEEVACHVVNQWRGSFPGLSLREAKELYDFTINTIEVNLTEYPGSRITWSDGEVIRNSDGPVTTREEAIATFPESVRVVFEVK